MKLAHALLVLIVTLVAPGLSAPALAQGGSPAAARELSGQHPAEYYKRAAELFEKGSKEDAVFLFYLGQLRFRTHLLAHPEFNPTGDPAIFASLSKVVGVPINQYAFGDIPALARTVDAVLAYDEANPDTFTPTAGTNKARADVRGGLVAMKVKMLAEADAIRATRQKNGLENR